MKRTDTGANNAAAQKVYFPAFLNLLGKKAIVIGGGEVAERKILRLLRTGAEITVISPAITKNIEKEKLKRRIRHIGRRYRKGDLSGAFVVIAATDSRAVNERVYAEAPCLVNVVDTPELCNFIVPSTVIRHPLTIAVSTGGVSPAASRAIRKELENQYGSEFAGYLSAVGEIRAEAMAAIRDRGKRWRLLKALASDKMFEILREKGLKEAKKAAEDLFKKAKGGSRGARGIGTEKQERRT